MSEIEETNISLQLAGSNMKLLLQLVKKPHKNRRRLQMKWPRRQGKAPMDSDSFCHCALGPEELEALCEDLVVQHTLTL